MTWRPPTVLELGLLLLGLVAGAVVGIRLGQGELAITTLRLRHELQALEDQADSLAAQQNTLAASCIPPIASPRRGTP